MKECGKHLEVLEGEEDIREKRGGEWEGVGKKERLLDGRGEKGEGEKRILGIQLARLFEEIAPANYRARKWGPLERVRRPDNTYRWLCPDHAIRMK